MKEIQNEHFSGERALYQANGLQISGTSFGYGESPLKRSSYIRLADSTFSSKFPLWHSEMIKLKNCMMTEDGRAAVWYTKEVNADDIIIEAPKCFRRCNRISLRNVSFPNGDEVLWKCNSVRIDRVKVNGDYFAMDCDGMEISGLELVGAYAFDGVRNVTVRDSVIDCRDAFWNSENVVIYNSTIKGKCFGWNSKNISLINCTVESREGMCYIDNLMMKNCKLPNTSFAFEYSMVNAEIIGNIDSIRNPRGGIIKADSIGVVILEQDKIDPSRTTIICHDELVRSHI
ncbi:DUF3737 family protein [Ruminococcus sp.]